MRIWPFSHHATQEQNFFWNTHRRSKQRISAAQMQYMQKRVRTYCLCSPGVYQCAECFGYHLACTENNLSTLG